MAKSHHQPAVPAASDAAERVDQNLLPPQDWDEREWDEPYPPAPDFLPSPAEFARQVMSRVLRTAPSPSTAGTGASGEYVRPDGWAVGLLSRAIEQGLRRIATERTTGKGLTPGESVDRLTAHLFGGMPPAGEFALNYYRLAADAVRRAILRHAHDCLAQGRDAWSEDAPSFVYGELVPNRSDNLVPFAGGDRRAVWLDEWWQAQAGRFPDAADRYALARYAGRSAAQVAALRGEAVADIARQLDRYERLANRHLDDRERGRRWDPVAADAELVSHLATPTGGHS